MTAYQNPISDTQSWNLTALFLTFIQVFSPKCLLHVTKNNGMTFCVKRCIIKRMRPILFIKGFQVVINVVGFGLEWLQKPLKKLHD